MNIIKALITLLFLTASTAQAEDYLAVDNAWIRAAPPGAGVMGGFLTFKNPSQDTIWIVAVSSPDFADIEFHESGETDGVSSMWRLPFIKLAPKEQVEFKPGGKHLMMFEPKKMLPPGAEVPIKLELGNGDIVNIKMPVIKP